MLPYYNKMIDKTQNTHKLNAQSQWPLHVSFEKKRVKYQAIM